MKGIYRLGLLGIASFQVFTTNSCFAQSSNIVPDNTLGAESSRVTENFQGLPIEVITGGTERGINLFHSFREFNVSSGRGAYFVSPNAEIQNILARVTGSNHSDILGTLGTLGGSEPNLFLINPNGIVFGENASLDVGGSFVATTANGINLGETGLFSASEPERSNLLAVNPSALFFNAVKNQAEIVNRSRATSTVLGGAENGNPNRTINGLQVLDGKSLLLVGGNVRFDGGRLFAPGGRVELGGLTEAGTVGLGVDGDIFSLSFPDGLKRGDVSLANQAFMSVSVVSSGKGDIAINSRNIQISGTSILSAGIARDAVTSETLAGDIHLNALGEIILDSRSAIFNLVRSGSIGNGGSIKIGTGSLELKNGSRIAAATLGQGDAGDVVVNAKNNVILNNSNIFSRVETGGLGQAGKIDVNAASLFLSDTAQLSTSTSGKGNAGNVILSLKDTLSLTNYAAILSTVGAGGVGKGGNIDINAASLFLTDSAQLATATRVR